VYRLEKDRLQAKLEAEDGDRRMVKTLEDARLRMANGSDGLFDTKAKLDSFQNAFRNHGIDVATLPIEEAARRIRTSPIADEMITALDDWCQSREPGQVPKSRLKEIVIAAETDPLRAAIRDAVSRKDVEALGRFCDREEDRRKFGLRLRIVFDALWRLDPVASIPRLERIRDEFPADYWFNEDLGMIYQRAEPPRLEDAVRCLSIAVALRPESPGGRLNLGGALEAQGKLEQAGEEYRKAIRLEPGFAEPRNNLGNVLRNQGKIDDAIAQYREAIRIKPNLIQPHYNLVNLFQSQGKIDDAIAEFREVLRIKPEDAQAHYALGNLLKTSGQLDPAIAEYRESIRIDHDQIGALCNLGLLLRVKGEFRESLEHLEHGHELGSRQPGWSYPSAAWVAEARRLLSLEGKILAILGGDSPSGDEAERHALMEICYRTDRHATAVRIADQALIDTPSLGDDPTNGLRFNAACSAILAASGRSRNEPAVEDAAKIGFREKALGWLRADLATWARILDEADGPDRGQFVARSLTHWKESGEIAPIRDSASLEKLPETEREAFRGLWREVDELLTRANLSK
jgi:tetratricopeptide (TPR) repeat protein